MQVARDRAGNLVYAEHADPAETYINPTCEHRMRLIPVGSNGRKAHFQHYQGERRPTCPRTLTDLFTITAGGPGRRSGPGAWWPALRGLLARWRHRLRGPS